MKRILCLIEALGSGGAERQLSGLAAMLQKDGNEVKVLTYYPKDFYKYVLDEAGVEYEYLAKAQDKWHRIPALTKAIKHYRPEIVICYSPSAAIIACLLKIVGYKYKLIVSERNSIRENNKREKLKFFFYRWADYVVPNSYEQQLFIATYYHNLIEKTEVITNFVDTDCFCPQGEYVPHQPCKIICVGRDNPQKNQLRFLDAVKILADKKLQFKVDWYGSIESDYGEQCVKKIKDLCIEEWIELKGETKNVCDEYRQHDVFCLPSIYEGFPNVLCEAMSCGLPVVCSNVCDNPSIVEDRMNGLLFNPNNTEEIANALEAMILMGDSEKKTMSKLNRERAVKLFSKEVFLKKYKSLF